MLENNKTLITLNEGKCDASSATPKHSETIDFGHQTGVNVSSCLILQKRLSLVLTCPKKVAGSEIGNDRPNLQNSQKWQNMTYFQICDMARKCLR